MAQKISQKPRGIAERPRMVRVSSRGSDDMARREIVQPNPPYQARRSRARLAVGSGTAAIIIGLGIAWTLPQLMDSTSGPLPEVHSFNPENAPSVASERHPDTIPPPSEAHASGVPQQQDMKVADAAVPPVLPTYAPGHDTAQVPAQDVPVSVPPADGERDGHEASPSASSAGGEAGVAGNDARTSEPPGAAVPAVSLAAASAPAVGGQSVVIYYLLGMEDSERKARQFAARLGPEFGHVEIDAVPHAYGMGRVRFSSAADRAVAQKVGRVFDDMGYDWRLIRLSGAHAKPRPGRIDVWIPDS